MAGGKAAKRKTAKRKTAKRTPAAKSKSPKKKSAKRVTAKRKSAKTKNTKRKTPKRASKRVATKRASTKRSAKKSAKKITKKKTPKKKSPVKKRSAVKNVISAAKKASKGKKPASKIEKMIFSELEDLAGYIHDAKAEIASLRPDEVKDDFLPTAEVELGAIVEATAEATHAIMDACEGLETLASSLEGEAASTLMDSTTKIYEACTFQDITGQRINKVVMTLQHIEGRVDRLISAFDIKTNKPTAGKKERETNKGEAGGEVKEGTGDGDLLEGPQLKGQGSSQAEVDDLLASFD